MNDRLENVWWYGEVAENVFVFDLGFEFFEIFKVCVVPLDVVDVLSFWFRAAGEADDLEFGGEAVLGF